MGAKANMAKAWSLICRVSTRARLQTSQLQREPDVIRLQDPGGVRRAMTRKNPSGRLSIGFDLTHRSALTQFSAAVLLLMEEAEAVAVVTAANPRCGPRTARLSCLRSQRGERPTRTQACHAEHALGAFLLGCP